MNSELENFIIKYQEKKHDVKAEEMYSFVQSYLQTAKDDTELKKALFLHLISKIPELFAVLTNFENAALAIEACYNEIEVKNSNLQGALLCLESLLMCFNQSETLEQLPSLFSTTLTVLYQSYTHCKKSEELYGDLLDDFTDQLGNFLNKIQTVQMAMVSGFNHLTTLELSGSEESTLVAVSEDLGKLCNLVTSLDKTLAVKLWRIFIKIITKYPELSRETITVDPILSALVSQIVEIVDDYKLSIEKEELVEESEIKLFLFFTNLVMKLFHAFHGNLKESLQSILMLTMKLTDLVAITSSPMTSVEIRQSQLGIAVRNTVKAIVPLFYSDSIFVNAVLQLDNKELVPDLQIACVLLKTSALDYYMKEGNNEEIFMKVMLVLKANNKQDNVKINCIKIPNSIFQCPESGEEYKEELVTLYQHAYIRLSKYSKAISDSGFEKIESPMLNLLISSSEMVSLLVSDIWIYRLRCSSVEYLHSRVQSLLLRFSQFQSNDRYKLLLQRMMKFLPKEILVELLSEHEELKLLFPNPDKVVHRYGTPDLSELQIKREPHQILTVITQLINELKKPVLEDAQLITKAISLLELFSFYVNYVPNSEIVRFAEVAKSLFESNIREVQIAVLTFLKALSGKIFDERDIEFKKVVKVLGALLADTLQTRNCIVKYEALNTYASLAQTASLGKIVRQTLVVAPNLAPLIKSYFSKVPLNGFLAEKERMEHFLKLSDCQPEIVTKDIKKLLFLKSIWK